MEVPMVDFNPWLHLRPGQVLSLVERLMGALEALEKPTVFSPEKMGETRSKKKEH